MQSRVSTSREGCSQPSTKASAAKTGESYECLIEVEKWLCSLGSEYCDSGKMRYIVIKSACALLLPHPFSSERDVV
ncbi:hypothetical protein CEXT_543111 [Caerostris extrusa]|uniref:Uncharacterized protein n=1 Tax=Caerostris extrusa TaxID=172846 RepID=A0AAV4THL0_CAEEX|nr:hypothetical protein CEXT_543111 [Caerostris extrusa]